MEKFKGKRKIIVVVLLLIVFSCVVFFKVSAETKVKDNSVRVAQDGLIATIETDKNTYQANEDVKITIKLENDNDFAVENVSIEGMIPKGLSLKNGQASKTIAHLEAKESISLSFVAIKEATKPREVKVTSIQLDKKTVTLNPKQSIQLKATLEPSNATNKAVVWNTSNKAVATVSSTGIVTAKGTGTATVTVTTVDGNKKATCNITVSTYVSMKIGKTMAIQNGNKTSIDTQGTKPFKTNGRTMLPIRFVGEKMGGKVTYTNDKAPIYVKYGELTVALKINEKTMKVTQGKTSKTVKLDVAATKRNGRVFLPLRAIGEALGFDIKYQVISGGEYIVVGNPKMGSGLLKERMDEAVKLIK